MPLATTSSAGNYREYPDRAEFDVSAITVAAWICYLSGGGTTSTFVRGVGNSGTAGEWRLGLDGTGKPLFNVRYSGAAHAATAAAAPIFGVWRHYIGRYVPADGFVYHYIDGVQDGSAAAGGAMSTGTAAIRVGEATDGTVHANVLIAHAGMWGVGLDADERQALANGVPPHLVRPDQLVIADMLEADSLDVVAMIHGTDAGNIAGVPQSSPRFPDFLRRMPWESRMDDDEEDAFEALAGGNLVASRIVSGYHYSGRTFTGF